jgi:TIR domain-containing protein
VPRSGRVPGIFISYRRDDSAGFAGRLYDRLAARFGTEHVFMDIDTITPGHEFAADIERALSACDACIVLIGRRWESIALPDGRRRLEDPTDFVRLEVAAAIRRGITVFPVLVEGAKPPEPASLPEDIRDVSGRQAIELSNERWNYDVGRLILALEQLGSGGEGPPPKETHRRSMRRPAMIAGAAILAVVAGIAAWFITNTGSGGLAACPAAPPSLPRSVAFTGFDTEQTYTVNLMPTCKTGMPGGQNLVWTGTSKNDVDPSWAPERWSFSPAGAGFTWTYRPKAMLAIPLTLRDDGVYFGSDTKGKPLNCPVSPSAERDISVSFGDSATTFDGWFVISWNCDGPFEVRFKVTGTRS